MAPANKENRLPKKPKAAPDPKLRNFLFQMVLKSENNANLSQIIKWTKKENLEFQLVDRQEVSRQWSVHKGGNKNMDYESLSRSLRFYYGINIMRKIPGKNFRYQFIPDDWTRAELAKWNARRFSIATILGSGTTRN
ncbi:hypothetical protein CRE_26759 [Caenorhabditis remanei]|uniref:ETS domain-containing protein n=1 Tax=Caenorhabditis remanei TaxID=31234 RepID=E3MXW7_CAERE|nr:hypothetical protein CRE_26759 [Caenorhabditis remanei]